MLKKDTHFRLRFEDNYKVRKCDIDPKFAYAKNWQNHMIQVDGMVFRYFFIDSNYNITDPNLQDRAYLYNLSPSNPKQFAHICRIRNHEDCGTNIYLAKYSIKKSLKTNFNTDVFPDIKPEVNKIMTSSHQVDYPKLELLGNVVNKSIRTGEVIDHRVLGWYEVKALNKALLSYRNNVQYFQHYYTFETDFRRFEALEQFFYDVKKVKLDKIDMEQLKLYDRYFDIKLKIQDDKFHLRPASKKLYRELWEVKDKLDVNMKGMWSEGLWNSLKGNNCYQTVWWHDFFFRPKADDKKAKCEELSNELINNSELNNNQETIHKLANDIDIQLDNIESFKDENDSFWTIFFGFWHEILIFTNALLNLIIIIWILLLVISYIINKILLRYRITRYMDFMAKNILLLKLLKDKELNSKKKSIRNVKFNKNKTNTNKRKKNKKNINDNK